MILKTQIGRKSPPVTGFSVYANVLFEILKKQELQAIKEIKNAPFSRVGHLVF